MSVLWLISGVVNTVSISIVCFITSIFNYHWCFLKCVLILILLVCLYFYFPCLHTWTKSVLACRATHSTNGSIAQYCSALPFSQLMLLVLGDYFFLSDHVTLRPWVSKLWPAKLYHATHSHICK
jgi:hypothetical protein